MSTPVEVAAGHPGPQRPEPGSPPAGWYPDPVRERRRRHGQRYWDGTGWTATVADGPTVGSDPMPPPRPDTRTALPGRAGWLALAGFVVGQLLALAGFVAGVHLARHELVVRLLLSQAGLWTGLVGACVLASRRWGTGRLRTDFAVSARPADAGWGLLVALVARIVTAGVLGVLLLIDRHLAGSNSGVFTPLAGDRSAALVLALIAVVGAPLVEETFFRGLLQRSLRCRLGVPAAVAAQALAFGCAHVSPGHGWGNVGVVLSIGLAGAGFGLIAEHYRRLGPGMIAHGLFNLVPVAVLLGHVH